MIRNVCYSLVTSIVLFSCSDGFTPKPKGFFRIDFPEKAYSAYTGNCPFTFEYPVYTEVNLHEGKNTRPCWLNLDFPAFKGRLHLSYFDVSQEIDTAISHSRIEKHLEDSRSLAYKHTIKAQAIDEITVNNALNRVHGIIYDIKGTSTASSLQFFLTDSTNHFLRGALYFSVAPRNDSLAPVINFIKEDIDISPGGIYERLGARSDMLPISGAF